MSVKVTAHLCSQRSQFQQIDVYDTEVFGKVLLLDGHVQLSTFDEAAYHESLVWVPLLNVKAPKSALIDGGVLRELCRHHEIEHIDMVEIDEAVVQVSREHLPELSDGAFDDARVHVHIADAFEFVKRSDRKYDLIVVDCTDVYEEEEGELSEMLFTDGFYRDVKSCLSDKGFVVTQADNLVFCPYSLEEVSELFRSVFPLVGDYWGLVPSFGGFSGFVWGSKGPAIVPKAQFTGTDFRYLTPELYAAGLRPPKFSR
jgi:spermidine synthase